MRMRIKLKNCAPCLARKPASQHKDLVTGFEEDLEVPYKGPGKAFQNI